MRGVRLTNITIDTPVSANFAIEVAWRYGTTGTFRTAHLNAIVTPAGALLDPIDITYDETISPSIQIRITYKGCNSTPYYQIHS